MTIRMTPSDCCGVQAGATVRRWSAGGYTFQSRLRSNSRSILDMGDYSSVGGNNFDEVFGCPTAAMIVPGNSGVYLSPSSTSTVVNTQSSKNCNITVYGTPFLSRSGRTD